MTISEAQQLVDNVRKHRDSRSVPEPVLTKSKYKNEKVVQDGFKFDSKKEALRYLELKNNPLVRDLQLQKKFDFVVNNQKVCSYIADFVYRTVVGEMIVEDTKSEHTRKLPVYRIKNKLMKAIYNIEIQEV